MEWLVVAALGVSLAAVFGLKFIGSVQTSRARQLLRPGARVIDVRLPEEVRARHSPVAISIPLGELTEHIGRHVTNQEEILLLHGSTLNRPLRDHSPAASAPLESTRD